VGAAERSFDYDFARGRIAATLGGSLVEAKRKKRRGSGERLGAQLRRRNGGLDRGGTWRTKGGERWATAIAGSAPKPASAGGAWTGEAVRGPLTYGPRPQCRVLNRFKPSKSIQTRSNLFQC
jgi:hypothetical protein